MKRLHGVKGRAKSRGRVNVAARQILDRLKKHPPQSQRVCVHFLQHLEPISFSLGNQLEVSRAGVITTPHSPSATLPAGPGDKERCLA